MQNKKAILIDPINTRLRTIVMPTTIAEHSYVIGHLHTDFADTNQYIVGGLCRPVPASLPSLAQTWRLLVGHI